MVEPDPVEALAAEYVERRHAGHPAEVSTYLDRLVSAEQRTRFKELVDGVALVAALMPRQVRPGVTVSRRYHVRREIGMGGMGHVFEAFDEQLQRSVALKVLDVQTGKQAEFATMFERESRALAALQHPNIVAVHEAGQDGDAQYIVMDLVDGVSLKDVITRLAERLGRGEPPAAGSALDEAIALPLPAGASALIDPSSYVRSVVRIAVEIARSLEAAHARGVMHRDLKPSNVLLRGGGIPVLLDFGLAGWLDGDRSDPAQGLYGTCAYLAPEQVEQSRTGSDPKSDLYQLGLLLYEMLTLQRAFPGEDANELMQHIVDGRFERPRAVVRNLSRDVEAITLKAIERDPRKRYASVREFREDLERFLAGNEAPLAARGGPIGMIARDVRYAVKRHRLLVGIAAAFLVGSIAMFVLVDRGEQPEVEFFVQSPGEQPRYGDAIVSVKAGDRIGVSVTSKKPVFVYAVSQFGAADATERVAPLLLVETDSFAEDGAAFRREVTAGGDPILCSQINAADLVNDPTRQFEGVRIFVADEPSPSIERWLSRLDVLAERDPTFGVSRASAQSLLDKPPSVTRGGPVSADDQKHFNEVMKQPIKDALARRDEEAKLFDGLWSVSRSFKVEREGK